MARRSTPRFKEHTARRKGRRGASARGARAGARHTAKARPGRIKAVCCRSGRRCAYDIETADGSALKAIGAPPPDNYAPSRYTGPHWPLGHHRLRLFLRNDCHGDHSCSMRSTVPRFPRKPAALPAYRPLAPDMCPAQSAQVLWWQRPVPGTWSEAHREILMPPFTETVTRSAEGDAQSIVLGNRPGRAASSARGRQAAVRRRALRFAAGDRCGGRTRSSGISEGQVASRTPWSLRRFQDQWGPRISMRVWSASAASRRRSRPHAEEFLGCAVGSRGTGPSRPHRAQQRSARLPRRKSIAYAAGPTIISNVGRCAIAAERRRDRRQSRRLHQRFLAAEQIDIAPYNFNFVQTLKAKDITGRTVDSGNGPGRLVHEHAHRRQCGSARPRRRLYRHPCLGPRAGGDAEAVIRHHPTNSKCRSGAIRNPS